MEENPSPRRRWFRFSLRTLFVLVTVLAVLLGWVSYSLTWIQQRREFLGVHATSKRFCDVQRCVDYQVNAPLLLRPFGEEGVARVEVDEPDQLARARKLFPESLAHHTREE